MLARPNEDKRLVSCPNDGFRPIIGRSIVAPDRLAERSHLRQALAAILNFCAWEICEARLAGEAASNVSAKEFA